MILNNGFTVFITRSRRARKDRNWNVVLSFSQQQQDIHSIQFGVTATDLHSEEWCCEGGFFQSTVRQRRIQIPFQWNLKIKRIINFNLQDWVVVCCLCYNEFLILILLLLFFLLVELLLVLIRLEIRLDARSLLLHRRRKTVPIGNLL